MKGEQLSKMIMLATVGHHGQFDKGGNPYILHCLQVMHYLETDDEELQCIAIGHDFIEDAHPSILEGENALREAGFSKRIVAGIRAMTKTPGLTYEAYKIQVMNNPDAILVKMADLRHNSDIRRLKGVTKKDIDRVERYHNFYLELKGRCK
jgi:(p)ppGpp synthase/HD superfamily hydrolase